MFISRIIIINKRRVISADLLRTPVVHNLIAKLSTVTNVELERMARCCTTAWGKRRVQQNAAHSPRKATSAAAAEELREEERSSDRIGMGRRGVGSYSVQG